MVALVLASGHGQMRGRGARRGISEQSLINHPRSGPGILRLQRHRGRL